MRLARISALILVLAAATLAWVQVNTVLATAAGDAPPNREFADLLAQFRRPPDDSKIMMRWWWFGPAVTRAEIEREMRTMKDAGIGGVEVQPVYPMVLDDPANGLVNLRYLSPEFLDAVKFTAQTANALGLRMDITMGSGWPYGGPHISQDLAAGRLLSEWLPVDAGATKLSVPELHPNEHVIAAFVAAGRLPGIAPGTLQQIHTVTDRTLELPSSPRGPRSVLLFIAGHTGMMVKRPAVGPEGFVLDHYQTAAIVRHLKMVGEPLVNAAGREGLRAIFCDSLEVYTSDWTADFLAEFRRRRGYDLLPLLPALMTSIGTPTEAVRHDWGQTLTELYTERFLIPLQAWCHRHGVLLRAQSYGMPPANLSSYAYVDLPEGEQGSLGRWNDFTPAR